MFDALVLYVSFASCFFLENRANESYYKILYALKCVLINVNVFRVCQKGKTIQQVHEQKVIYIDSQERGFSPLVAGSGIYQER